MAIPLYVNTIDVDSISEVIHDALRTIAHAFDHSGSDISAPSAVSPHLAGRALRRFFDLLQQAGACRDMDSGAALREGVASDAPCLPGSMDSQHLSDIGNQGLQLLDTLGEWAQALSLPEQENQIRAATVMVALWLARHGGELNSIESVVNTLAEIANSTTEYDALVELSDMMSELASAISPQTKFDFENNERRQPWRVLNLNRGIIATRSHDTRLMENAFDDLIRNIPEDAEMFFRQGMQQMEELDYPEYVRDVVSRYYHQSKTRVLH